MSASPQGAFDTQLGGCFQRGPQTNNQHTHIYIYVCIHLHFANVKNTMVMTRTGSPCSTAYSVLLSDILAPVHLDLCYDDPRWGCSLSDGPLLASMHGFLRQIRRLLRSTILASVWSLLQMKRSHFNLRHAGPRTFCPMLGLYEQLTADGRKPHAWRSVKTGSDLRPRALQSHMVRLRGLKEPRAKPTDLWDMKHCGWRYWGCQGASSPSKVMMATDSKILGVVEVPSWLTQEEPNECFFTAFLV